MAQLQRSHQSPVSRQSGTGTASAANIAVGDPLVSEPTIGQKRAAGESLVAMPSLHNVACEGKYWHIALAEWRQVSDHSIRRQAVRSIPLGKPNAHRPAYPIDLALQYQRIGGLCEISIRPGGAPTKLLTSTTTDLTPTVGLQQTICVDCLFQNRGWCRCAWRTRCHHSSGASLHARQTGDYR